MEPLHEFVCESREEGTGAVYAGEGSERMLAPGISPEVRCRTLSIFSFI